MPARLDVGAGRRQVVRLVVSHGMALVLMGGGSASRLRWECQQDLEPLADGIEHGVLVYDTRRNPQTEESELVRYRLVEPFD